MEPPSSVLDDYFSRGLILLLFLAFYSLFSGIWYACRVTSETTSPGNNSSYLPESFMQILLLIKIVLIFLASSLLSLIYAAPLALILIIAAEAAVIHLIDGREEVFLKRLAPVTWVVLKITLPMSMLISRFSGLPQDEKEERDAQEFEEMEEILEEADIKDKEETRMLKGIAALSNTSVSEIMSPRVDMVSLSTGMTSQEVMERAIECGYSRLPVYDSNPDNIKGFLYIKDLVGYLRDGIIDFNWQKHIRKAYFVPGSKKINDLLEEFRQKKIHLAMVVDEYGGTDGIVTLEDVLEEIVGEIEDESDNI